jgi:hypothetical protein
MVLCDGKEIASMSSCAARLLSRFKPVMLKKTARADQINFPVSRKAGKIRAPIFRVLAVGHYKRVHIYTSLSEYQINVL